MKSLLKYSGGLVVAGVLSLMISTSVSAQRPSRGSSGGQRPSGSVSTPQRPARGTSGGVAVRPGRPVRPAVRPYSYRRGYAGIYRPYYRYFYPSIGFRLRVLPWGYASFYYGPDLFFYYNGIFYRNNNDYYEVVTPPVGAEVPSLPSGASEIRINGELFYEKNGVYYQETTKEDGKKAWIVAGKDGELNTSSSDIPDLQEGDIVDELPVGSRELSINGQTFFTDPKGFYYQEINEDGNIAYKVVGSASH